MNRVSFISLRPGGDASAIEEAIRRVIDRGWFVLGPEVEAFEQEFAQACSSPAAVGVGSGTDAIALTLRALNIGRGDEVITTPLSAAYTALAVMMTGARPVFADIEPDRLTLDPAAVAAAIGPRTVAVLPVHLYGQPADMASIGALAARHNLAIVEDCCQAHLATYRGQPVGTFGIAAAFSFYPTKNLGAIGDGGAIVTADAVLAERLRRLRHGGQSSRYCHEEAGVNTRLDELQAAVLRARLPYLRSWTERRRSLAARYRAHFQDGGVIVPPETDPGHVYHLFIVRSRTRERFQRHLAKAGIETLIHYPVPIPRQPALASQNPAECPVATEACQQVVSLPLHHQLSDADAERVIEAVKTFKDHENDK